LSAEIEKYSLFILIPLNVSILSVRAGWSRRPGEAGTEKIWFFLSNPFKKYWFERRAWSKQAAGSGGD